MQVVVCLPTRRGTARFDSRIGNRIGIGYPVGKVDNIDNACVDGLAAVCPYGPEGVDLLIRGLGGLAGKDQEAAIRRKFEDAPIEVARCNKRGAVGSGGIDDPGIAAREISKLARYRQG